MGSDEPAKLGTLLKYWVEHNQEHSQEIKDWADKARAMGKSEVAADMLQASGAMDQASERLSQALKRLEG